MEEARTPDESETDDAPLIISGLRIDVLEWAFSWYIRSLDSAVSRDLDRRLGDLEVARGKGKITALLLVDDYPGIRPSDIANVLMRDRPATGRIIERLLQAGLMTRATADEDQRAQELTITPKGHEIADRVRGIIREQEDEFFDFIAPEDREQFLRLLKRVYSRMRDKW